MNIDRFQQVTFISNSISEIFIRAITSRQHGVIFIKISAMLRYHISPLKAFKENLYHVNDFCNLNIILMQHIGHKISHSCNIVFYEFCVIEVGRMFISKKLY